MLGKDHMYALLYGPMISEEIRAGRYAFAQLGCLDDGTYTRVHGLFHGSGLFMERSTDIAGISWSVILKNVYAMAFGMADELQLGDNVRGYLTVASVRELDGIVRSMGGCAGSPWELGLSETHQVLRANNLRDKVRLQTDGGLKTGLDVIKAAILGAESFGFGTGPMVALGCKYLRICHLNNCATGVATQNNVLRRHHFIGLPEMVMNYFRFIAQEVREWLAVLGARSLDEVTLGPASAREIGWLRR